MCECLRVGKELACIFLHVLSLSLSLENSEKFLENPGDVTMSWNLQQPGSLNDGVEQSPRPNSGGYGDE